MKPYGEDWDENDFPLAYLITIRTHGTWLHGDQRGSVNAHHGHDRFGSRRLSDNPKLEWIMRQNMASRAFLLDERMREAVKSAIGEVCRHRGYTLFAANALRTHAHAVVAARSGPEPIANAFKSYATRKLREHGYIDGFVKPWSRGRSRRYLWKDDDVAEAINYVLYGQGDIKLDD